MAIDPSFVLGDLLHDFLRTQAKSPLEGVMVWDDQCEYRQEDYRVLLFGPADSPYAGGLFACHLYTEGYAPSTSRFVFLTAILHPNVDAEGRLQTELLFTDDRFEFREVLQGVRDVLREPVISGAWNSDLAALYSRDRRVYRDVVADFTRQFAY